MRVTLSTALRVVALLMVLSAPSLVAAATPDYHVVGSLVVPGIYSRAIQDSAGYLYGTSYSGGIHGNGMVFKLGPDGSMSVLHSFDRASDGATPFAGLTFGADGKLYGTTMEGGANNIGTVYGLATDGSGFVVLHDFSGGASDGANPYAALTLGSDGNLYGVTANGGATDAGIVFSLVPNGSSSTFTVLHTFDSAADGAEPYGALVQGSGGILFGATTKGGGAADAGTVYSLAPGGSGFTVLHAFDGTAGRGAFAGLSLDSGGNLYGTTVGGGTGNSGVVYKLSPNGSGFDFSVLHSFDGTAGGAQPYPGVTVGSNDKLYGATTGGGANSYGIAYALAPDGSGFNVLHSFDATFPFSTLTLGSAGILYGTTMRTALGFSTVYKIAESGSGYAVIHSFDGIDNATLYSGLAFGADGNLYGTSGNGGSNGYGTVYKFDPVGAGISLLHSFNMTDGATPQAELTLGVNGKFYGTANSGGESTTGGTIFELDPSGTPFTLLHSFVDAGGGATPVASLIQAGDGNLYGATVAGGANGVGTIYRIAPGGAFTLLHSFDGTSDGGYPYSALTLGPDGELYGSSAGTRTAPGTLFKLALDGSGFTVLHSFDQAGDGRSPFGSMFLHSDGNFYGTTVGGGAADNGAVFRIAPNGSGYAVLHSFDGTIGGGNPMAGLTAGSDGKLYGTTVRGGGGSRGVVFQIAPDGTFTIVHAFDLADGGEPYAGLTADPDGNFYGTTTSGAQGGIIYRVCLATCTATTLASSLNPSTFGSQIIFTATVSGPNPTGTVSFKDGGSVIGTATISAGTASFTTAGLSVGAHRISATYAGDPDYSASTSPALTQIVNPRLSPTTTTLKSSPNPSKLGASVNFAAVVTGSKPTGTVMFKEGAAVLGTATIKKGRAGFTTKTLSVGTHNITASYGGDANNAVSTSNIVQQTVKPRK